MKGIYSALLVSFDKEGNINEKGLRQIVRHNIDNCKIDGLYVGGSTGENFMLSTDEKKRIFEIAKDEAKNDVKLIAQVGSVNLKEAVELAKFTTDLGYDAISAVTPFYYKFDFQEIKHYYETIINSVDNKLIIYSIPFLTGVNMSLDQFGELFENEKIIGVKFTAADFYLLERMRKRFPDKLIYAGFDEMMLPATVLGVDGAIGSTFNVNGVRARQIFELAKEGKVAEALEIQHITNDLITDILNNGLYQTIKAILEEQGVEAGYCRQPMKEATNEMIANAKEINNKYFK
ncbi:MULTISPECIES: N-acetylneuraminate lyase [Clostridia]|jgi:N-acetylneuraminate lyase|uniref:N-acetylneuraminate lyase n=1 Tax=Paraclostridium bifermentans TaxID=1490 RepID=UPI0006B3B601|nr:N-acetylneuraminate lyase [Paraclostridium bifermentans]MBS6508165.1 N-acetylneuraminate lyase [Paraclostridium bifermentans]MDU3336640.1 N-acetylneuraminate lyase [Paraclostridium bifermentans]MDU3802811.1 N-acetylneuraminate lyase [Paraclostridium bifermentans]OSB09334.1 N-acetylneuraminate lyase [Paraclostridium bifermentans]